MASLLKDIYGENYTYVRKMETITTQNGFKDHRFLNGPEEALAFANGELVAVENSCQRKVGIFCHVARLAYEGRLQTNTTWWQMKIGQLCSFATPWKIAMGLATVTGTIMAALALL